MKNFFMCIALLFLAFGCSKPKEEAVVESEIAVELPAEPTAEEKEAERKELAIQNYISALNMRQRLSQLFLVNLQGNEVFEPVEFEDDKAVIPGGYIFFSFNIGKSAKEIMSFSDSIADYCAENALVPPYLAIDQEGGLVNRLRGISSSVPSNRTIAAKYSEEEAAALYASQSKQLALLGFSLNLAPVSEVSNSDNSDFLGTRSYGGKESVEKYASLAVRAYEENGIGTVLKHFPGNTNTDPHTGLPEIKLSDAELQDTVVEPFAAIIRASAPSAILMSHARTQAHDGDKPACFSRYWISEVLRDEIKFDGLVFSDDIFMAALEKNGYPPEKAVIMAVEAGVNCIMLSEKKFVNVLSVLEKKASEDSDFSALLNNAVYRIIRYKTETNILLVAGDENPILVQAEKRDLQERLEMFETEKKIGDACVK